MGGGAAFHKEQSTSRPVIVSPFGTQPYRQATHYGANFGSPLSFGFGFGPTTGKQGGKYENFLSTLDTATGPLADYIRQGRSFLPSVFGQAQGVGSDVAAKAPGMFAQLQQQIQNYLQGINEGPTVQRNQEALDQAFSPVQNNALYANSLRQSLQQSREGAGGRGLLDAGSQQGAEDTITRDLAAQNAQNQFGNQQTALGTSANLLNTQNALGQGRIDAANAGFNALPQLAGALSSAFGIPMDALNNVFSTLTGGQQPSLDLLKLILPTVAQRSHSFGWGQEAHGGASGGDQGQ